MSYITGVPLYRKRELISADARLRVADGFAGRLDESPYFGNYERWTLPWKLAVGEVDGEPAVVIMRLEGASWRPYSIVRLDGVGENIVRIRDYAHCPWMIPAARSLIVADPFNVSRDYLLPRNSRNK